MEQPDHLSFRICCNYYLSDGEKGGKKRNLSDCIDSRKFLYVHHIFFHFESENWIWSANDSCLYYRRCLTALYFAGLIKLGRKYAASHEEE